MSEAIGASKAGASQTGEVQVKQAGTWGPVQADRTVKVLKLSGLRYLTLVGHLNKIRSVILQGTLVGHLKSVM